MKTITVSDDLYAELQAIQDRKIQELEEQLERAKEARDILLSPSEDKQPQRVVVVKKKRQPGTRKTGLMHEIVTLLAKERALTAAQIADKLKGKYNIIAGKPLSRFTQSVNGMLCQYSTGSRGGLFLREKEKGNYVYNVKVKNVDTSQPQSNGFGLTTND